MTRRVLALTALIALIALGGLAGGCTATDDSYGVDAFADLVLPGVLPGVGAQQSVTGRFEVLSPAARDDDPNYARVIAAYRVQLPAGAAPWVRLWSEPDCNFQGGQATLYQDLGLIRQVGDEVHFFERDVVVAGRTIDLDVGTTTAQVTLDDTQFGRLYDLSIVVQVPDDTSELTTVMVGGGLAPVGGPRLACGNFSRSP